ncbi:MAG: sigma-70 family RNA polymerase sigma factor [Chitinophagales bacterium]
MKTNSPKISEEQLVALLKLHNKVALNLLYDSYAAALYGVIMRITQSKHHAENILQDTFIKIWKNIDSYDASKGRFFTWMLNIARNASIDFVRSKAYRKNSKTDSIDDQVYTPNELSTETNVHAIGLQSIVEKLNPDLKQIIDLVYFQGFTQREIADQFDIPLGTVKSRVRIAIRELRKLM